MKQKIQFFVSYAHRNSNLTQNFIERLSDVLAPSKRFEYSLWKDTKLILGEDWEVQIAEAIENCDFGLLLSFPDPVMDLRLFELAADAYRRRGTPKLFLDSQTLTNKQKAELYDKVVLSERGRPTKNNPYK